jgi:hypothetical protein
VPWRELEEYRQLLQDYDRAREDYFHAEAVFNTAQDAQDLNGARDAYDVLAREHATLLATYNRLRQMRSELAQARDARRQLVASL